MRPKPIVPKKYERGDVFECLGWENPGGAYNPHPRDCYLWELEDTETYDPFVYSVKFYTLPQGTGYPLKKEWRGSHLTVTEANVAARRLKYELFAQDNPQDWKKCYGSHGEIEYESNVSIESNNYKIRVEKEPKCECQMFGRTVIRGLDPESRRELDVKSWSQLDEAIRTNIKRRASKKPHFFNNVLAEVKEDVKHDEKHPLRDVFIREIIEHYQYWQEMKEQVKQRCWSGLREEIKEEMRDNQGLMKKLEGEVLESLKKEQPRNVQKASVCQVSVVPAAINHELSSTQEKAIGELIDAMDEDEEFP